MARGRPSSPGTRPTLALLCMGRWVPRGRLAASAHGELRPRCSQGEPTPQTGRPGGLPFPGVTGTLCVVRCHRPREDCSWPGAVCMVGLPSSASWGPGWPLGRGAQVVAVKHGSSRALSETPRGQPSPGPSARDPSVSMGGRGTSSESREGASEGGEVFCPSSATCLGPSSPRCRVGLAEPGPQLGPGRKGQPEPTPSDSSQLPRGRPASEPGWKACDLGSSLGSRGCSGASSVSCLDKRITDRAISIRFPEADSVQPLWVEGRGQPVRREDGSSTGVWTQHPRTSPRGREGSCRVHGRLRPEEPWTVPASTLLRADLEMPLRPVGSPVPQPSWPWWPSAASSCWVLSCPGWATAARQLRPPGRAGLAEALRWAGSREGCMDPLQLSIPPPPPAGDTGPGMQGQTAVLMKREGSFFPSFFRAL